MAHKTAGEAAEAAAKIIGNESVEMQMKKLYIVMGAIITPETEPNTKAALGRCGEMEMEQDAWGPLIGI